MDIYERLLQIEHRLDVLEAKLTSENTQNVRMPVSKKTEYLPQVTEEMVELSKMDKRVDTVVTRKRGVKDTNPELRAAVSAVSRAVEVAKEAQLLVEDVQHLARTLMDSQKPV